MIFHGIVLIVTVATVMTTLSFALKDYYRKVATSAGSIILWLAAAAGSPTFSYPYQLVVDNTIKTGVHHVSGPVSWLAFLWMGMAIIMALYSWYSVTLEGTRQQEKM